MKRLIIKLILNPIGYISREVWYWTAITRIKLDPIEPIEDRYYIEERDTQELHTLH